MITNNPTSENEPVVDDNPTMITTHQGGNQQISSSLSIHQPTFTTSCSFSPIRPSISSLETQQRLRKNLSVRFDTLTTVSGNEVYYPTPDGRGRLRTSKSLPSFSFSSNGSSDSSTQDTMAAAAPPAAAAANRLWIYLPPSGYHCTDSATLRSTSSISSGSSSGSYYMRRGAPLCARDARRLLLTRAFNRASARRIGIRRKKILKTLQTKKRRKSIYVLNRAENVENRTTGRQRRKLFNTSTSSADESNTEDPSVTTLLKPKVIRRGTTPFTSTISTITTRSHVSLKRRHLYTHFMAHIAKSTRRRRYHGDSLCCGRHVANDSAYFSDSGSSSRMGDCQGVANGISCNRNLGRKTSIDREHQHTQEEEEDTDKDTTEYTTEETTQETTEESTEQNCRQFRKFGKKKEMSKYPLALLIKWKIKKLIFIDAENAGNCNLRKCNSTAYSFYSKTNTRSKFGNCCAMLLDHTMPSFSRYEYFTDRWDYLNSLAACVIGFSNFHCLSTLWAKHGGILALVPYIISLVCLGIPLVILELSLGQLFRGGAVKCLDAICGKGRIIAVSALLLAFIITVSYILSICHSLSYLCHSFSRSLPWMLSLAEKRTCAAIKSPDGCQQHDLCTWRQQKCVGDVVEKATLFLNRIVTGGSSLPPGAAPTTILPMTVLWAFVIWTYITLALYRGPVHSRLLTSVTVAGPFLIMIFLTINALSFEGATNGLVRFFTYRDASVLLRWSTWRAVTGSMFYSLSLASGTLIALASFSPKMTQNVVVDAVVVSMADFAYTFLSAIAVACIAGSLQHSSSLDDSVTLLSSASSRLITFVYFPVGLGQFPAPQVVCAVFFVSLAFLGIDSAIMYMEGVMTVFTDSCCLCRIRPLVLAFAVGAFGLTGSLIFCTDAGSVLAVYLDEWVMQSLLLLIAFFQCCAVGWAGGAKQQAQHIGYTALVVLSCTWILGAVLGNLSLSSAMSLVVTLGIFVGGTAAALLLTGAGKQDLAGRKGEVVRPCARKCYTADWTTQLRACASCNAMKHPLACGLTDVPALTLAVQCSGNVQYNEEERKAVMRRLTSIEPSTCSHTKEQLNWKNRAWWLLVGNIELYRWDFNFATNPHSSCIPFVWVLTMKYLAPFVLLSVLMGEVKEVGATRENSWRMAIALVSVLAIAFIWIFGIVYSKAFVFLLPRPRVTHPKLGKMGCLLLRPREHAASVLDPFFAPAWRAQYLLEHLPRVLARRSTQRRSSVRSSLRWVHTRRDRKFPRERLNSSHRLGKRGPIVRLDR